MAELTTSLESKLRLIQQVLILAAWTEDARQALGRLEELRHSSPDMRDALSAAGVLSPMEWSQDESEALVGIMQMAERACNKSEELACPKFPRVVGDAAA